MLTVVRRLWGQALDAPSGVVDHSKARQSARISPGPSNSGSAATSWRVGVAPVIDVEMLCPPLLLRMPAAER